jgi:hypothetical protein
MADISTPLASDTQPTEADLARDLRADLEWLDSDSSGESMAAFISSLLGVCRAGLRRAIAAERTLDELASPDAIKIVSLIEGRLSIDHWATRLLVASFADTFTESGATNVLEVSFDHPELGRLTVTAQRQEGKTPMDLKAEAEAERDKLQAFKDWCHAYLDAVGVPHHPPGTHGAAGCRIGDRMDWLMDWLTAKLAAAEADRDALAAAATRLAAQVEESAGRLSAVQQERDGLRRLLGLVYGLYQSGWPCYEPGLENIRAGFVGTCINIPDDAEEEIKAALEGKS